MLQPVSMTPPVRWKQRDETIAHDAKLDGLFPLVTDLEKATVKQVLLWYKFRSFRDQRG